MNCRFTKCCAIILLLVVILADSASEAVARAAAFSFDSVWFYRDGTRVVPEIGTSWLTVVFDPRSIPEGDSFEASAAPVDVAASGDTSEISDPAGAFIKKKARTMVKANRRLSEYLYDPNLAEDACFLRMRNGLKLQEIRELINRLSRDGAVAYVHPTVIISGKTYAYFNAFDLKWKTGTSEAQRQSLLRASHAMLDENDPLGTRHTVNVARIPFFKAFNLLAEDIRILRATPRLVEVKPSISAKLALFMSGGNIGDNIPFTLTIAFSELVKIDPSSIATLNLRPPELQQELFDCTFDPYDYAASVSKSPIVITGRMAVYAPGEFSLPPVKISYSCPSCPDSSVRTIETEPVPYRVSSIIPKAKSENRLIVPTDPVAHAFRHDELRRQSLRSFWFAMLCFAGLVPCALWAFRLRPKVTAERNLKEERKKALLVAGRLRVLLLDTPADPHWSYLGEAGGLLREYLLQLYGIDAKYRGGSGRRFMETIEEHLPPECCGPLRRILSAIDDSVALESEKCQDIESLQRDMLVVVDQTARDGSGRG